MNLQLFLIFFTKLRCLSWGILLLQHSFHNSINLKMRILLLLLHKHNPLKLYKSSFRILIYFKEGILLTYKTHLLCLYSLQLRCSCNILDWVVFMRYYWKVSWLIHNKQFVQVIIFYSSVPFQILLWYPGI